MVRIKLVTRKIKNPTGYFSQEFIPAVCPGCGMTFGYSDRQFIAHINRCEALKEISNNEGYHIQRASECEERRIEEEMMVISLAEEIRKKHLGIS